MIEADGALDKKLAAMVEMNRDMAEAVKVAPVAQFVMGGGSGQGGGSSNVENFMALQNAANMKALGLNMDVKK
ncbi:hypothetical protein D3C78_1253270 [compost metagenome]